MGNHQSRPEDRLRNINREVNSIRTSVKLSRQNISKSKKEFIVGNLAKYSSDVSSLNGKAKRKDIEDALKNISETMEEVLGIETSELDSGAVESHSFVNLPLNKSRSTSLGSLRSIKKSAKDQTSSGPFNRSSPSLRDIEAKVEELRSQVVTAISNRDTRQLKVHQETLVVLTAELELIPEDADTHLKKRKDHVSKKVIMLYQKASKALKELKLDDNNRNKSKSQKKQKAIADLGEIEMRLAKSESMLDTLFQDENADFSEVHSNIVENNRRLASVDIVDNEIKERVVLLSQKLSETVRNLDQVMAKREFDSKFAKYLKSYERLVRNFNANSDLDSTLNNLEVLRASLENLEEINETTKSRKKDLLNNININIGKITETMEKDSDKNIVKDIVEDNVILRKNLKSSDKEFTVIDQFISYWNNVKVNFNVNAYSDLSLLRIDSVLEDMQVSINELRIAISKKCNTNLPTNLIKKRSQSVPKLNSRDSNDGRKSQNILENNIIKTSAKIYDIPKHEVQNMEGQQVHPNNRFSKVEQIKLQVHYIKEKFNESSNKSLLKKKLEEYQKYLAEYVTDSNHAVANNAQLVLEEIHEIAYKILLDNFRQKLEQLSNRTQSLKGTKKYQELNILKSELTQIRLELENLEFEDFGNSFESILNEKERLLNEVLRNLEILQDNNLYLRKNEEDNVKRVNAKLQELKDKVNKFSGIFGGVQYNQIERDLNKLLLNIGELNDKAGSNEMAQQTEKLSKILEQRASLAQSFKANNERQARTGEQIEMSKIKTDLQQIKKDIDRTPENNFDAFVGLQSRLDLINFELSQKIVKSNENLAREKDIYLNETQTLKNVVDAKVSLSQKQIQWPQLQLQPDSNGYSKNDVNKEIETFENAFENIKEKISSSTSEQARHTFYEFANDIKKLRDALQSYNLLPESELCLRQSSILEEMNIYIEILEKEASDINFMYLMEQKTDELEEQFLQDPQNKLSELQGKLDKIRDELHHYSLSSSNETLKSNKLKLERQTDLLIRRLEDLKENKGQLINEKEKRIINDIEQNIKIIEPQITSFIGLKSSNEYYQLNESIISASSALDKVILDSQELHNIKTKLLKELNALGNVLNERAQEIQQIAELESALDKISSRIEQFAGTNDELQIMKENMENIRRRLTSLKLSNDLAPRKNECVERYFKLQKQVIMCRKSISQDNEKHFSSSSSYETSSSSRFATNIYSFVAGKNVEMLNTSVDENADNLSKISTNIDDIAKAIESTNGLSDLQKLDDALIELAVQLKNLNYEADTAEHSVVKNLNTKIENLIENIEEKMQDNDRLIGISEEVDELINKLTRPLDSKEIDQIDERLNQLLLSLKKMNSVSLKGHIDGCMHKIILSTRQIREHKNLLKNTAV